MAVHNANSFVVMSCSLQYLSDICLRFSEYGIGLKCLKYAYKLCVMDKESYMLPSFVEKGYRKNKKAFVEKLKQMKCGFCGKNKGKKLKSCTGCMKVYYCNRNCQKLTWKVKHHHSCKL